MTRTLLLAFIFLLNGCIEAALVGAAGGAGYITNQEIDKNVEKRRYAVEREERYKYEDKLKQERTLMQAKLPTKDEYLTNQILRSYLAGELTHVFAVTPQVQNGVVTLFGVVPSPTIADRAVASASRIPGVKQVVSRLMINERKIEPIVDANGQQARPPYPHSYGQAAMPVPVAAMPAPAYQPVNYGAAAAPALAFGAVTMNEGAGAQPVAMPQAMIQPALPAPYPPAYAARPLVPGGPEPSFQPGNPTPPASELLKRSQPPAPALLPQSAFPAYQPQPAIPPQAAYPPTTQPNQPVTLQNAVRGMKKRPAQDLSHEPPVEDAAMLKRPKPSADSRDHWYPTWQVGN
jgi:hypothetical protein